MKQTKQLLLLSLTFIIVGASMLVILYHSQQSRQFATGPAPITQSNTQSTLPKSDYIQGQPSELILPSLDISLPVISGVYNPQTKQWTLSLDKVQYAAMTPPPNNATGNTFIYGHYRKGVLASLHTIQMGALAVVKTQNGHSFYYQLSSVRTTNPEDSSVFNYQGAPILTIQTCTGLFYQQRQLFTFNLIRVV